MSNRLLIVEDDAATRLLLSRQTGKLSLFEDIHAVSTGQEALDYLVAHPCSLVIMDISLPGKLDGIQAAKLIDDRYRTPILFISALTDKSIVSRALQTDAFGYLTKPYNERDLTVAIDTALIKGELSRKLRENQARLSAIISTITTGVITTNQDGIVDFTNPAARGLLFCCPEEAIHKPVWECLVLRDEGSLAELRSLYNYYHKEDTPLSTKPYLITNREGENRHVQITISCLQRGYEKEYCLILNDVTSHYEAEKRLSMLATAMESNTDAIIITGLSSKGVPEIRYVNESFVHITGWSREDSIGQSIDLLSGQKTSDQFIPALIDALREGKRFRKDGELYREDGNTFLAEWSLQPIESEQASDVTHLHMIRDVTQIRRMEENLRQSQKLEAVGRLAGGIAHDFNNILSVINSFVDLIELKLEEQDPLRRYVDQVRNAGQRGADLVGRLMQFSRGDEPQLRILNPGEVLHDMEPLLRQAVPENIELIVAAETDISSILIDIGQLEQILVNLSVNARDAVHGNGHIHIHARNLTLHEQDAEIPPGKYVCLEVKDDGSGIPQADLPHIFEPFFTTKPAGKGTGLGLATVFSIVRQCEGHIRVKSQVGRGSTFTLYLPAITEDTHKPEPAILPEMEKGNGETILIVEDDRTFAECISGLLSLQGYKILRASDGQEALEKYQNTAQEIDLVLTDIVMPYVSGREMTNKLRMNNPDLKVIFMTGYDEKNNKDAYLANGTILLQKPFSLNTILKTVRKAIDHAPSTP